MMTDDIERVLLTEKQLAAKIEERLVENVLGAGEHR